MTDAQRGYNNFEELSEYIVRHIFKDTAAEISRTPKNKDGGYDIIAELSDGKINRKVYFECKLRSANLNLRDIAANVIIAFNEGAITLVVFTNYNYTVQADENLNKFSRRTILNIKIIIGEEIKKLVQLSGVSVSKSLEKLIARRKTKRRILDTSLQIDFSKVDAYKQLFYRSYNETALVDNYVPQKDQNKLLQAKNILQQRGILVVIGLMGIGKRMFVASVLKEFSFITIHIDAALHNTQELLLLDMLLNIWGIPTKQIIEDFTVKYIDTIIEKIGQKLDDDQTINILRRLFGDIKIQGINDENYNLLICNYILDLLHLHQYNIQYLFYIENLEYANTEIAVLLKYLIISLHKGEIPCIIIHDSAEYEGQQYIDLRNSFGHLENFFQIELSMYTKKEALAYIHYFNNKISDYIARLIVNRVGVRQSNITMFLKYLENTGIPLEDFQRISQEIQELSPNSVPAITNKIMYYYRDLCRSPFDMMFLLGGKVAEILFIRLGLENNLLDQLVEENIFVYKSEYYIPANPVVWEILEQWGTENNPSCRRLAQKLLQICNEQNNLFYEEKAYLYKYIGRLEQALKELSIHIGQLENTRQFDALISCYDTAIELSIDMHEPTKRMYYIIQQLEILWVKKELLSQKSTSRLEELTTLLKQYSYLDVPHYYYARDYFIAKREFKNGIYDINSGIGAVTKHYYEETIAGNFTDNTGDWLGRLCYQYALYVKESQGNNAALSIFKNALNTFPDSFTIWREYYSHLGCMKLYDSPDEAFIYYNKIIESFSNNKSPCALPFHEYGDRAMTKLLDGDAVWAEDLAQDALNICEANGIVDELGRIMNIKGCAILSQGRASEALLLFKESFQILKISGYKLYRWRSQLNYVQLALDVDNQNPELIDELDDAYICFFSLFQNKINQLIQNSMEELQKTREYHALLLIGICLNRIKNPSHINIFADFKLDTVKTMYEKDLWQLINNPKKALKNSPYYRAGKIMMIG